MQLKIFMFLYSGSWAFLLPFLICYLFLRGRLDPLYRQHIAERFGKYKLELPQNPIWVHAVSIGELRSAITLIKRLSGEGENILVTVFTPAARREAYKQFSEEIIKGNIAIVWVPFDMKWCHRRLITKCKPKICLPLEVEIWPNMILTMKNAKIPLYLCNSQYASRSFERDILGLKIRQKIISLCAGAFVKSEVQRLRFSQIGLDNIVVTGELRFDQEIPKILTDAAESLRKNIKPKGRKIITIASGVHFEEPIYREMIRKIVTDARVRKVCPPLFIYVPRAPERFAQIEKDLVEADLTVLKRSTSFGKNSIGLQEQVIPLEHDVDVLLGDSLGEMFFYLSSSDKVIVGGGFSPRGAHNIIEALAVGKPVFVGPYTWTIEFPFLEASAHMIAESFLTIDDMIAALLSNTTISDEKISQFMTKHRGASDRTITAIYDAVG